MNAPAVNRLPYRPPTAGRDYWVLDDALRDPEAVRARLLARTDWDQGAPYRPERWFGLRALAALADDELFPLEAWARNKTRKARLLPAAAEHNVAQLVAAHEATARPHTDSRALCRYAAVLYLTPDGPAHAGTTFFRTRLPEGGLGGNTPPPGCTHLVEALGTRFVPPDLFVPDVAVDYRHNRLLLYRADMIHSDTAYFGDARPERRLTLHLAWLAE